jgi:hypothetical protein
MRRWALLVAVLSVCCVVQDCLEPHSRQNHFDFIYTLLKHCTWYFITPTLKMAGAGRNMQV